jgi:prepilin-type N-terminal cleavage/methylation domain-containing protein
MRRTRAHSGFTLIELIISMGIVVLAIALAGAGFAAQNQGLQSSDLRRQGNASTRDAMVTLEQTLRTTGWGIDPRWAIDRVTTTPTDMRTLDSITAPDHLTVLARNPLYQWVDAGGTGCAVGTVGGCFSGNAWAITAFNIGARQATISMTNGQVVEKGRVVVVQCIGGTNPVALTVATAVQHAGALGPETITFDAVQRYPYNDFASLSSAPAVGCHAQAGASMYLVDRSHFFIQTYAGRPWLMLETGLDLSGSTGTPDGTVDSLDWIPLAKDIEDMQVAFVMNRAAGSPATDSDTNFIVGDELNAVEQLTAQSASNDLPQYTTPTNDVSRRSLSVANVRGIRVNLVTRSARADPNRDPASSSFTGDIVRRAENARDPANQLTGGRFLRFPAVTEVSLRNMDSQRPFTF